MAWGCEPWVAGGAQRREAGAFAGAPVASRHAAPRHAAPRLRTRTRAPTHPHTQIQTHALTHTPTHSTPDLVGRGHKASTVAGDSKDSQFKAVDVSGVDDDVLQGAKVSGGSETG